MFLLLTLNIFTPFCSVSIVDFEQVNVSWDVLFLGSRKWSFTTMKKLWFIPLFCFLSFLFIYLFIYFLLIYKCIISQNGQAHFKNLAKVCLTFLRRYALKNQKQPPEVFLGKVVAKQLYWNRTSAWVFSCKFAPYFQSTFSKSTSWRLLLKD